MIQLCWLCAHIENQNCTFVPTQTATNMEMQVGSEFSPTNYVMGRLLSYNTYTRVLVLQASLAVSDQQALALNKTTRYSLP